jgi:anthranilate/para-aminobenzoate synthase component I
VIVLPGPSLPVAVAARRAASGSAPFWLSSPGDGDVGLERSVVGCDPVRVVQGDLALLERAWSEERASWGAAPEGVPVAVGFLSYDLGRRWTPSLKGRSSGWPDLEFRFYEALWVKRDERAEIWARDQAAAARLRARLEVEAPAASARLGRLQAVEPPARHLEGVARILEYLRAGDVYQVNLARQLRGRLEGSPLALFTRLQAEAPAPHGLFLGGEQALLGNSPERFLRLRGRRLETRPIKGTRPPEAAPGELERAPKDRAEHVMIVDLERNDLGRVCQTGTVEVVDLARTVELATVQHLVTTVRGQLREEVGLAELLRATFPGGSITGAPKLRAMQIIDELESAPRGPYTGATGWLGAAGDLDLAVAIRTATVREGELRLWVGGGVVIDSTPEGELAETEVKARAFARLAED